MYLLVVFFCVKFDMKLNNICKTHKTVPVIKIDVIIYMISFYSHPYLYVLIKCEYGKHTQFSVSARCLLLCRHNRHNEMASLQVVVIINLAYAQICL